MSSRNPVVADVSVSYRRSLLPFSRYSVHTDFIGFSNDNKSLLIQQKIVTSKGIASVALFRVVFVKGKDIINVEEYTKVFGKFPIPSYENIPKVWQSGVNYFTEVKEEIKKQDNVNKKDE